MAKRLITILLPVVLIGGLVTGGLYWIKVNAKPQSDHGHSHDPETPVEDFELYPVGEKPVKLSSISAKVLILNFWATWCEACIVEMPSLVELRNKFQNQGLELLAISVDENPDAVLPKAAQEFKFSFPYYSDKTGELADRFDVSAIPHTVVLSSERKILWVEPGERNWMDDEVVQKIQGFLKEKL